MTDLFLHVFNISMTAGWIVLAALVLRAILRDRLPGWVRCALWGVAGVRLLFPVSWESIVSLIPSAEPIPPTITTAPVPSVNVGIPAVDAVINPVISQTMTPAPEYSVNPMQIAVAVGATVWLVGVAAMLIYYVISTVRLHRRLAVSIPYRDNVYLCDHLPGPILVGVFRPRIYIPSETDPKLYPHILAHEGNHLKRGDHVWKPLGFLLLSVYWINPLLWVAYALLSRDMERACDEKTINGMSEDERIAYYLALVACSERKPTRQLPNPVGFGEHKIIERVKHMKKYKKPTVWATALCVLLIAVTAVCFLTNPVSAADTDDPTTPPNGQETTGSGESGTGESVENAMYAVLNHLLEISHTEKQEFIAPVYAQGEKMVSREPVNVAFENGAIYLQGVLCQISYAPDYRVQFVADMRKSTVVLNDQSEKGYAEAMSTMDLMESQVGCYLLEIDDTSSIDSKFAVYEFNGTLYFLTILENDQTPRIYSWPIHQEEETPPLIFDIVNKYGVIPSSEVERMQVAFVQFVGLPTVKSPTISFLLIGEFDGVYVTFAIAPLYYAQWVTGETVGNYKFTYPSSDQIDVYYDGVFCRLTEAYQKQWLDDEDIAVIYERYREVMNMK